MPISGLVLTLDPEGAPLDRVLAVLSLDSRLTLGPALGAKLPVVSDTQASEEAEALVNELIQTPGIAFVDVVFVDLSTDHEL
jgi:hypothetical protein